MLDKPASLADLFRALLKRLGFEDYDPARYYMRGPGPKSKALQRVDEQPGSRPPPTRNASGPDEQRR
jgi:hypothetical protein